MRWFLRSRDLPLPDTTLTPEQIREDARTDRRIEIEERAGLPCSMCDDIGEPHVCERAWWQQKLDHLQGRQCADDECACRYLMVHAYRPREA